MSAAGQHRFIRALTVVAVVFHLVAIVLYLTGGLVAPGMVLDALRPLPTATAYAAPAVLAVAGLRGRTPLLLAASIAAGMLALFPFSLHSFVLAPAAIIYAAAYARLAAAEDLRSTVPAVIGCPLLLVAAFLVLVIQDHPACYEEFETGEVIIDRDPDETASGSQTITADSGVIGGGCTSDTIVWWEATASLLLSGAAVATGLLSTSNSAKRGPEKHRQPRSRRGSR